jgi:hypothetical protein
LSPAQQGTLYSTLPVKDILFAEMRCRFGTGFKFDHKNALMKTEIIYLFIFLGGLECVGHSFAYIAHFVF